MRLIDADKAIRYIAEYASKYNISGERYTDMCTAINLQPTAYDVDKVVEQLDRVSIPEDKLLYASPDKFGVYVLLEDAVKIIKDEREV